MVSFSPVCAPTILTISYIDDFTRVRLRSNGVEGSDYVNANFVNVSALIKCCLEACHFTAVLFRHRATGSIVPTLLLRGLSLPL